MNSCKNCNEPVNGNYCSNCGRPATLKRVDGQYIIQEIGDFLFANKGMLYTIKRVLISPGESVREFITEDRYRFVKPITFVFVTSLIYMLVNYLFGIGVEDYYQPPDGMEDFTTVNLILNWMLIEYPGYAGIITGLFMAFWIKIFFRKSGYNLFEIFILLCFVTGITTLFISVVTIIQGITYLKLIEISSYVGMIYLFWAIGQFFDKKKAGSYIKAFLSFMLGSSIMGILIVIVGVLIDIIIKY